ncbi:hypothetical protein [Mesorhizobium waimense]|nr:hypothetical protein [Mesorhizobium waimense]
MGSLQARHWAQRGYVQLVNGQAANPIHDIADARLAQTVKALNGGEV